MSTGNGTTPDPKLASIVNKISDKDIDVVLYCGNIAPPGHAFIHNLMANISIKRKNVLFYLTTLGGLADEGYRIMRCIQDNYPKGKINLFVDGYCESAGTLMATGAHEITMSDTAELGPLDVQIYKKDEIGELTSGLTPGQALSTLQSQTFNTFTDYFSDIYERLGGLLSTQNITKIATELTIGCLEPIYRQIDPMRLTEYERSVLIAKQYGSRLSSGISNLLAEWCPGQPDHGISFPRIRY
jgi:Serine dehydrogenase proteinase